MPSTFLNGEEGNRYTLCLVQRYVCAAVPQAWRADMGKSRARTRDRPEPSSIVYLRLGKDAKPPTTHRAWRRFVIAAYKRSGDDDSGLISLGEIWRDGIQHRLTENLPKWSPSRGIGSSLQWLCCMAFATRGLVVLSLLSFRQVSRVYQARMARPFWPSATWGCIGVTARLRVSSLSCA